MSKTELQRLAVEIHQNLYQNENSAIQEDTIKQYYWNKNDVSGSVLDYDGMSGTLRNPNEAMFRDPLVFVESLQDIRAQFTSFQGLFSSVKDEIHAVGELVPKEDGEDYRIVVIDSTGTFGMRFVPKWIVDFEILIPLRTQTYFTFCRNQVGDWKVLKHVDEWDVRFLISNGIGSLLSSVTGKFGYGIANGGYERVQKMMGWISSRAVEASQGRLGVKGKV